MNLNEAVIKSVFLAGIYVYCHAFNTNNCKPLFSVWFSGLHIYKIFTMCCPFPQSQMVVVILDTHLATDSDSNDKGHQYLLPKKETNV